MEETGVPGEKHRLYIDSEGWLRAQSYNKDDFNSPFIMGFEVQLHIFTLLLPCCDIQYDFHVNVMFGSS
jgi:hypothetical protein